MPRETYGKENKIMPRGAKETIERERERFLIYFILYSFSFVCCLFLFLFYYNLVIFGKLNNYKTFEIKIMLKIK